MKKIALYILAAAAVFAGCSKNNINTTPVDPEDAWMYDATLPVPIKFTAGNGSLVKSSIDDVDDMVGKTFGFYAINSGQDPANGNWTTQNLTRMPMPQGATAKCEVVDMEKVRFNFFETQADGTETPVTYYYDQGDWTPYTFYGYYAHINDVEAPDYRDDQSENVQPTYVSVRVGLGHTDILWGKAEAEAYDADPSVDFDWYYGFNARYIRKTKGEKQPFMKFKHVTSCVNFTAQVVASNPNATADMTITSFVLEEVPVMANLFIAHRDRKELEGTFQNSYRESGNLSLDVDETMVLTETPQSLGESFFLCPTDDNPEPVKVKIAYKFAGKDYEAEFTLNPNTVKDDGTTKPGFVAGYRYNYNVKVYAPEQIVIEATIEKYKDAWTTPEDIEVDKE